MANEILRPQTEAEKKDFTSIYEKDPHTAFKQKMYKEIEKATKKGIPFAEKPCLDDYEQAIKSQVDSQLKKYGSIKDPIKPPEIDLSEYSNLKNFKLVDQGEVRDENLSKQYKTPVYVKKKVYTFKEYGNKYIVMEDRDEAVKRALKQ